MYSGVFARSPLMNTSSSPASTSLAADPADDPALLRAGVELLKSSGAKWLDERDTARKALDEAREALEACRVFTTPLERLKGWSAFKEDAARRLNRCLGSTTS